MVLTDGDGETETLIRLSRCRQRSAPQGVSRRDPTGCPLPRSDGEPFADNSFVSEDLSVFGEIDAMTRTCTTESDGGGRTKPAPPGCICALEMFACYISQP